MAILRKPYEISIWEDIFDDNSKNYIENRIAVIGSDVMTSPNKAFSPVLTKNMNGEVTFTFSMAYKYFDPSSNAEVINPFIGYLINERKVKLHYPLDDPDAWYDLIIVDHQEDSESMVWQYTAKDIFVNELSKNGYAIEFSTELGNNQGTAVELAKATVKNTDWTVDETNCDLLVQKVHEPMLRAEVKTAFSADKVGKLDDEEEPRTAYIKAGEEIYVFYSYIANREVKYVQFLRKDDEETFTFDDNNNIIGRNYRITSDVSYRVEDEKVKGFDIVEGDNAVNVVYEDDSAQYTNNQGYRIVYGPLTTYDPVMERTVERYQTTDGREIYKYSDSDYTTSNVVMSYITNGSDFNIYENGTIQGWSNAVATTKKDSEGRHQFQHLGLTSYPEIGVGVQLVPLTNLTRVEGFLELKFEGQLGSNYENTYFNSGFMDNAGFIDHIAGGEEFVFRIACAKATGKHGELTPLDNPPIHALVAEYTEPLGKQALVSNTYYKKIDTSKIYLNFNGNWTKDNPTITGGTFSTTTTTDEETGEETTTVDYKNYIIDGVIQEPTTNSVYIVDGDENEYVWDSEKAKYILKSESNFIDYYYTTATASQALTNTALTDPSILLGIFLYTDTDELCAEDVYTYISNVQLTRCVRDKNKNPVTIGNVPTTTITETPTYYLKPSEGATKEKVDVYYNLAGMARSIGLKEQNITPIYNEDSEKILSISEAQSNCFNILQTICETFECWLKLDVQHDDRGAIIPGTKKIQLKEFAGKKNFAGFKYGINLKSIQRTLNSEEIVTKLIVDNVQSDYVDEGVMSIRNAAANPSGESNIINFSYYVNKGLIKNVQGYQSDLNEYYTQMKKYNTELNELNFQKSKLELALTKIEYNRNVYTELIDAAAEKYAKAMADFEEATGLNYNKYVEKYGTVETITSVAPIRPSDIDRETITIPTNSLIPTSNDEYEYSDGVYGFAKYGENTAYYADRYKQLPLKDNSTDVFYVRDEGPSIASVLGTDGTYLYLRAGSSYYRISTDGNNTWSDVSSVSFTQSTNKQGIDNTIIFNGYQYYFTQATSAGDHDTVHVTRVLQVPIDVYRLFEYVAGAWEQQEEWIGVSPSGDNAQFWNLAITNASETDHGASTLENISLPLKLNNYGYAWYDEYNYLGVKLAFKDNPQNYQYHLYRWNSETFVWELIYNKNAAPSDKDDPDYHLEWSAVTSHFGNGRNSQHGATTLNNGDLANHEAIIDIVADLYVSSSTINNYAGILTNINKEYDEKRLELYGARDYDVAVSSTTVESEFETYRYSRLMLSDYIDGNDHFEFYFLKNSGDSSDRVEYESSVSSKVFEVYVPYIDENSKWYNCAVVTNIPKHYSLLDGEYDAGTQLFISPDSTTHYTLAADSNYKEAHPGYAGRIKEVQDAKDAYEKTFYSRYSRFIKEGTWSSNDYIDANLYYLDALQTSANSAMPKVEYSIEVAEVSELEGLENYIFDVGDKTYIEDTEFFGWNQFYINHSTREIAYTAPASLEGYEIHTRPAREEIIVSQVEWHLDEPETNVITVQNYKTRFEDLFQRLSATVQTVQYNEATYAKTSAFINEDGTINQDVLLNSLNGLSSANYMLTSDGSVVIDRDKIIISDLQNLTKSQNRVKIDSRGISISNDAGQTWTTALNGEGIDAGIVTSGELNTKQITIVDGGKPTFRWDTYGISAYKKGNDDVVDLTTYVRFDQYGLYGVQGAESYKAQSLLDVKRDAQFGITWDGFFIKNSYTGGGLVQITSDNDFQVINADQTEKIKIGALEWTNGNTVTTTPIPGVAPSLYGIRINNNDGETVFKTGDDGNITITGTINATAGEIGGMSVDNDRLRMDHIVFEPGTGIYSDWGETSSYPFIISDEDGSATFNNVTVRGAIKTSVFEYEEIQAVGGAFLFRPSSSVSKVQIDGNDLIFTVEKPLLFKVGSYVKISNYTSDDAGNTVTPDELNGYGLTYIYPIESINGKLIKLTGAAEIINDGVATLDDLAGGALIDMGNEAGTSNYGIGINSSDGFINLPPRAISLFETTVHPNQTPKISYNYRGILGTLPDEREHNLNVNTSIYQNMRGTQGIYTNNMYIGDNKNFITYYYDKTTQEYRLIINADTIYEGYDDEGDPIPVGGDGKDGEDAITVIIDSSAGNMFVRQDIRTTLTCHVYQGSGMDPDHDITDQVTKFTWVKYDKDGVKDETWARLPGGQSITIGPEDVASKAIFKCEVEF